MKIGMLTSGGDCQGLNSALRGVAKTLYNELGHTVAIYGIRDGYRGLIEGDYHIMHQEDFSDILTRGGIKSMAGTFALLRPGEPYFLQFTPLLQEVDSLLSRLLRAPNLRLKRLG